MATQENNVPSFTFTKKLGAGKLQLVRTATYTDNQTLPAVTGSVTLGVIAADKTLTFADGSSEDDGVIITVFNKNDSAFNWNVSGNVVDSSTLDPVTVLETGLHMLQWEETEGYWVRLTTGSGGSSGGGLSEGTMYS